MILSERRALLKSVSKLMGSYSFTSKEMASEREKGRERNWARIIPFSNFPFYSLPRSPLLLALLLLLLLLQGCSICSHHSDSQKYHSRYKRRGKYLVISPLYSFMSKSLSNFKYYKNLILRLFVPCVPPYSVSRLTVVINYMQHSAGQTEKKYNGLMMFSDRASV